MTFRYFKIFLRREPERPRGLLAYNRDGDRLDMLAWSHLTKRWEHDPEVVASFLLGDDQDRQAEISREEAEELARTVLGSTVPTEAALMAISDEAERQRAQRYGDKLPEGHRDNQPPGR